MKKISLVVIILILIFVISFNFITYRVTAYSGGKGVTRIHFSKEAAYRDFDSCVNDSDAIFSLIVISNRSGIIEIK